MQSYHALYHGEVRAGIQPKFPQLHACDAAAMFTPVSCAPDCGIELFAVFYPASTPVLATSCGRTQFPLQFTTDCLTAYVRQSASPKMKHHWLGLGLAACLTRDFGATRLRVRCSEAIVTSPVSSTAHVLSICGKSTSPTHFLTSTMASRPAGPRRFKGAAFTAPPRMQAAQQGPVSSGILERGDSHAEPVDYCNFRVCRLPGCDLAAEMDADGQESEWCSRSHGV